MSRFLLLLLLALACSAQETWELFYPAGSKDEETKLVKSLQPLLPKGVKLSLQPLPEKCRSASAAQSHAHAIDAGVHTLPCLVLRDEKGAYAALPLQGLTAESITHAQQQAAAAPDREQLTRHRRLTAQLYYLRALWTLAQSPAEQDTVIAAYREALQRPTADETARQHIGFYCLYPALMQQYAAEYNGGHSPRTENKLLEAIAAIEAVRDTNPETRLGRLAYDERERLRAARLKSRQYE